MGKKENLFFCTSTLLLFILPLTGCKKKNEEAYPFPHKADYVGQMLSPEVSDDEKNKVTEEFYDLWKKTYVRQNEYETKEDQYYVWYSGQTYSSGDEPVAVTVSEAHGYGMVITAYMAGYDCEAKEIYDGMYRYFKAHPSENGANLMAWQQSDNGSALIDTDGVDSAMDGDLDIAYSLLLADKQWGSDGKINYKEEAIKVLEDIMQYEINQTEWTLQLGDWVSLCDLQDPFYTATRSSDFMAQHLKEFANVISNEDWKKVAKKIYEITDSIAVESENQTGLLPDFIVKDSNGAYIPSYPDLLEGETDGQYSYNACRMPWRIGTDYLVTGDEGAKRLLDLLNAWIVDKSGGNPNNILAGYQLNGTRTEDYQDLCFTAPFLVAAMCQDTDAKSSKEWVNSLWNATAKIETQDYFGDTIKMMVLITASGNWWSPSNVK